MPHNMGPVDSAIRAVIGLLLISLVFVGPRTSFGWIGLLPLLSAFFGWCPPYSLLKINTCRKSR